MKDEIRVMDITEVYQIVGDFYKKHGQTAYAKDKFRVYDALKDMRKDGTMSVAEVEQQAEFRMKGMKVCP